MYICVITCPDVVQQDIDGSNNDQTIRRLTLDALALNHHEFCKSSTQCPFSARCFRESRRCWLPVNPWRRIVTTAPNPRGVWWVSSRAKWRALWNQFDIETEPAGSAPKMELHGSWAAKESMVHDDPWWSMKISRETEKPYFRQQERQYGQCSWVTCLWAVAELVVHRKHSDNLGFWLSAIQWLCQGLGMFVFATVFSMLVKKNNILKKEHVDAKYQNLMSVFYDNCYNMTLDSRRNSICPPSPPAVSRAAAGSTSSVLRRDIFRRRPGQIRGPPPRWGVFTWQFHQQRREQWPEAGSDYDLRGSST